MPSAASVSVPWRRRLLSLVVLRGRHSECACYGCGPQSFIIQLGCCTTPSGIQSPHPIVVFGFALRVLRVSVVNLALSGYDDGFMHASTTIEVVALIATANLCNTSPRK